MEEKKKSHFFDLKFPLGGLLSFYGLILVIYGLFTDKSHYQRSLGLNVNFYWGILLLVIGGGMLLFTWRKNRPAK